MLNYSIIIPTYNRGDNIKAALDSLSNQNVNLEVIVIDDGSTDNTKEIVATYYKTLDIKYIHQKNQGVSKARNTGLKHVSSKTDYVIFLDSDDFFGEHALTYMDEYLKKHKVGIAVMNMQIYYDQEVNIVKLDKFNYDYVSIDDEIIYPHYYIGGTAIALKVIRKNNFKFNEDIDYFEDAIFVNKVILTEGGYGIVKDALYNYVNEDESPIKTKKRFDDVIRKAYPILIDFVRKNNLSFNYLSYLIFYNQRFSCSYQYLSTLKKQELKAYQKRLQTLVKSLNLEMLEKLIPNDYRKKVLSYLIYNDPACLNHKIHQLWITREQLTSKGYFVDIELMKTYPREADVVFVWRKHKIKPYNTKLIDTPRTMTINGIKLMYPTRYLYQYRVDLSLFFISKIRNRSFKLYYKDKKVLDGEKLTTD
jgi:glycosyltransferase involved in cell wall biosynthesis